MRGVGFSDVTEEDESGKVEAYLELPESAADPEALSASLGILDSATHLIAPLDRNLQVRHRSPPTPIFCWPKFYHPLMAGTVIWHRWLDCRSCAPQPNSKCGASTWTMTFSTLPPMT